MSVVIKKVETKSDRKKFVKLQWKFYKGDPNFVAPLITDRLNMINDRKHPFYKDAELELLLAEKNGELLGKIAVIVNYNHNKFHNDKVGFFGFFECANDQEVANKLFDAAKDWLKTKGMNVMRGPMNPSVNYEIGMLINAFDQPPVVMMPYNPPYYPELLEKYGFVKAKDLYAYLLTKEKTMSDKLERVSRLVQERRNFRVRPINMHKFNEEVEIVKKVYNDAWSPNWGFIPYTDDEFRQIAKELKTVVLPELVLVGELDGKAVAFALSLPDINEILIKNPSGRLFPTGALKLILGKRKVSKCRIIVLGVVREYQKLGFDSVLYYETWKRAAEININIGEASWILEDNMMMNRAAELMNADIYKKYRIYDYNIG